MQNEPTNFTSAQKAKAWGVHIFTASGVIFALLAIISISKHEFVLSMFWLIIAFIIDALDGTFARRYNVKEVLPNMSGKNIDFVIDFATYAIIPAYLIYEAYWMIDGVKVYMLPEPEWIRFTCVAIVLMVSAVYYGKEPMVSEDMFFIGFPVMWNAVAYYMFFIVRPDAWVNVGLILMFAILHFIPWKWAYTSQNKNNQLLHVILSIIFVGSNIAVLYFYPDEPFWLRILAGSFLPYTVWVTYNASKGK